MSFVPIKRAVGMEQIAGLVRIWEKYWRPIQLPCKTSKVDFVVNVNLHFYILTFIFEPIYSLIRMAKSVLLRVWWKVQWLLDLYLITFQGFKNRKINNIWCFVEVCRLVCGVISRNCISVIGHYDVVKISKYFPLGLKRREH